MGELKYTGHQWAVDVASGKVLAGRLARLACERYLRDLEEAGEKGFWFDEVAAKRFIVFASMTNLVEGEWAGEPFVLEPWQQFIFWNIFGWKWKGDGTRRFRKAYVSVAKKNGKSPMGALVGLYMMAFDGEPRAQVYAAAKDKDQAKIVWGHAKDMVAKCDLQDQIRTYQASITHPESLSFFKPLSKETKNKDGINPHCAVIDEYHAHENNDVIDNIESAFASRRQPLEFFITTRGFNRNTPCYFFEKMIQQVLEGVLVDEAIFGIIFCLDKDDKDPAKSDRWDDDGVWIKANPNLGVSVKRKFLQQQVDEAKNMPSKQNNVETKNMNMWTDALQTWISADEWKRGDKGLFAVEGPDLMRKACWGGLDLASVRDTTAFVKVFHEGEDFQVQCVFFLPHDQIDERVKRNNVNYDVWVRNGLIVETPGNVIDYDFIKAWIQKDATQYDLKSIAYDRFNSSQLVIDMQNEGIKMTKFGQGFVSMSAPTKEVETLALTGRFSHEGNEVLAWMISNVTLRRDAADNVKIDKKESKEKVDGAVALVMAYGEYLTWLAENEADVNVAYASRGLRGL